MTLGEPIIIIIILIIILNGKLLKGTKAKTRCNRGHSFHGLHWIPRLHYINLIFSYTENLSKNNLPRHTVYYTSKELLFQTDLFKTLDTFGQIIVKDNSSLS